MGFSGARSLEILGRLLEILRAARAGLRNFQWRMSTELCVVFTNFIASLRATSGNLVRED